MPKRDGYEVAAYVKSRPKLAHIPVVLLTGAFEPVDQARAKRRVEDVLAKPFEPQMVINRVKELLGGSGRKRCPRQRPWSGRLHPPDGGRMPAKSVRLALSGSIRGRTSVSPCRRAAPPCRTSTSKLPESDGRRQGRRRPW